MSQGGRAFWLWLSLVTSCWASEAPQVLDLLLVILSLNLHVQEIAHIGLELCAIKAIEQPYLEHPVIAPSRTFILIPRLQEAAQAANG